MRDMVTIIRDRVQAMGPRMARAGEGGAPDARLRLRYGRDGAWTTDLFVEAVYRSVVASR
jgi:hypothetical protein